MMWGLGQVCGCGDGVEMIVELDVQLVGLLEGFVQLCGDYGVCICG